jgi:hypothetical protein
LVPWLAVLLLLGIPTISNAVQESTYHGEILPIPEELLDVPHDQPEETLSSPANESLSTDSVSASKTGTVMQTRDEASSEDAWNAASIAQSTLPSHDQVSRLGGGERGGGIPDMFRQLRN